ncbi:hypothetical protein CAEBREN_08585 [Caenorhabditis brenneri]|uniref:Hexosyltransferase n=1 Tax=Caenorhabditis brenneri TaxID=135651 RepID=G0MP95_CAEBE|nr:hypothetical protein CAEBREN_08585 [Caenorhabditis brenneri]
MHDKVYRILVTVLLTYIIYSRPSINVTSDFGTSFSIAFADVQKNIEWIYLPEIDANEKSEVLMIVLSRSDNYGRRNVLRKTWMNKRNSESIKEERMKALFLVGMNPGDLRMKKMILEEARLYGDLIVADLNDSYDQLSYKTLTLLLFATRKAPQFNLIGKIDEDVVFFPDQLTPLIENKLIKVNTSSMYGYLVGEGLEVNHIHHGKWFIPISAYSCLKYPGYLSGPFYLTTKLAAEKIITATKHRNFLSVSL